MDIKKLKIYYETEQVQPYHGIDYVDALRSLSQDKTMSPIVREHFAEQYHASIIELGSSRIDDFGERLYNILNGSEPPVILETVDSFTIDQTYRDWTLSYEIRAVRVRIPYFERVKEYAEKIGRPIRLETEYVVLDMEHQGRSMLKEAIDRKYKSEYFGANNTHPSYGYRELPWVCDNVQYMLFEGLCKTGNGFGAEHVVKMTRQIKGNNSYSYNGYSETNEKKISYLNGRIKDQAYFIGDELAKFFTIPSFYEMERINKELEKTVQQLW